MADYPKCLYRDGKAIEWDGHSYDLLIADDAEAEAKAKAEGWATASQVLNALADPLDHDGSGDKGGSLPNAAKPVKKRKRG